MTKMSRVPSLRESNLSIKKIIKSQEVCHETRKSVLEACFLLYGGK
jgi:hypothetical protein